MRSAREQLTDPRRADPRRADPCRRGPSAVPVAPFAFPGARPPRRRLWNPGPVHRHLRTRQTVIAQRDGRVVRYRLASAPVTALLADQ